ncbi:MAG: thioredoxin family protein [Pseudomonadota bacterium]
MGFDRLRRVGQKRGARLVVARVAALLLAWAAAGLGGPAWAEGDTDASDHVQVELFAERSGLRAGEPMALALRFRIRPGWHIYWRNPGASGLPTVVQWTGPAGAVIAPTEWPAPQRISEGDLTVYGYHGAPVALTSITLPEDAEPGGRYTVRAEARWLACREMCVPGSARVSLPLSVMASPRAAEPITNRVFAKARSLLPAPPPDLDAGFTLEAGSDAARAWMAEPPVDGAAPNPNRIVRAVSRLRRWLSAEAAGDDVEVDFFPIEEGMVAEAPERLASGDHGLSFDLTISTYPDEDPFTSDRPIEGVAVLRADGDPISIAALSLSSRPAPDGVGVPPVVAAPPDDASEEGATALSIEAEGDAKPALGLLAALAFALFGGLLLNLMPCVLPVLSIKAVAIAGAAGEGAAAKMRRHGAAFTLGAISAFVALAGALGLLRAGGEAVGWGFQLQSPFIVAMLVYVMMFAGLSLSGLCTVGARLMGLGPAPAAGSGGAFSGGLSGAFLTGALAVIVAAPCTGPLMAPALAFALTQPATASLLVFAVMGLGLAAPLLAISAVPAIAGRLPRPGPWMERLKQGLAFPMYAAAIWLLWVLSRLSGPDVAALAMGGVLLIAFAAWVSEASRGAGPWLRRTGLAGAGLAGLGALALAGQTLGLAPPVASALAVASDESEGGVERVAYSAERLEDLRAAGKPVFVDFTAAWCITCQTNKFAALSRPAVEDAFRARDVVLMTADWTARDPAVTEALEAHGRSGVPLYLYYAAGADEPQTLPQILTTGIVMRALRKADAAQKPGAPAPTEGPSEDPATGLSIARSSG